MATKTVIQSDGTIKDFFDWVKADGSTDFQPEAGRYHLYGQHLCPFAHRAMIARALKGLENVITYDNVDYVLVEGRGWKFSPEKEGCDADSVNGCAYLKEVYEASAKKLGATGYSGTVTVPVLFDKKLNRIVSNDSATILRMFNSEFNEFCPTPEQKALDLFPESLRPQIEEVEGWTQKGVIYAVYGPAMAKDQEKYDQAIVNLYGGLDKVEEVLSKNRYLLGKQMTEADVRLFVSLIRFDPVYVQMRCSKKRLVDYPNIWAYTRDIYQTGNTSSTVDVGQIIKGHFLSYKFKPLNPFGVVPAAPDLNYNEPSLRDQM